MQDLFAPPSFDRETFSSRGLAVVPVKGDAMYPTLRGDWDYVLAAPVSRFPYDACYVIDYFGKPSVFRFQSFGPGKVRMSRDNPHYRDREEDILPSEWFDEHVLGIVVCELKVKDPQLMQAAQRAS